MPGRIEVRVRIDRRDVEIDRREVGRITMIWREVSGF